jgi:hypothetical protein
MLASRDSNAARDEPSRMSREWFEKKKVAFSSVAGTNRATGRQSEAGGTCGGKRRRALAQIALRVSRQNSRARQGLDFPRRRGIRDWNFQSITAPCSHETCHYYRPCSSVLIFVVFGSNAFLCFIPMGLPPQGLAGEYLHAFVARREAERRMLLAWSALFSTKHSAIPLITHDES